MFDTDLRRKLAWLIAIRAVISTVLLGSATLAQVTAPGSFPIDPFFSLIGLTYALTIFYAVTLRYVDRFRWLVDLQLVGDALVVSAFIYLTGGITSYFSVALRAADRRRQHRPVPARRPAGRHPEHRALRRSGRGTVLPVAMCSCNRSGDCSAIVLPPPVVAGYTVTLNVFGFFAVALLSGRLAEEAAVHRRAPRSGLDRDRRPARVQPARHRQPAERPRDDRSPSARSDVQPCRRPSLPACRRFPRSDGRSPRCCSCRLPCSRRSATTLVTAGRGGGSSSTGPPTAAARSCSA